MLLYTSRVIVIERIVHARIESFQAILGGTRGQKCASAPSFTPSRGCDREGEPHLQIRKGHCTRFSGVARISENGGGVAN